MKKQIQKNILDLKYTTMLQHFTTTITLGMTFVIGVAVVLITGGAIPLSILQRFALYAAIAAISCVLIIATKRMRQKQQVILQEIAQLEET